MRLLIVGVFPQKRHFFNAKRQREFEGMGMKGKQNKIVNLSIEMNIKQIKQIFFSLFDFDFSVSFSFFSSFIWFFLLKTNKHNVLKWNSFLDKHNSFNFVFRLSLKSIPKTIASKKESMQTRIKPSGIRTHLLGNRISVYFVIIE